MRKLIFALLLRMLQHSYFVPLCFTVFVGIRLALLLLIPIAEPFSDSAWYLSRAITLAEQGTYSERGILTAYWPVGYPAFLALLFKVAGASVLVAQLANLALAAISFWLLYFVVRNFLHDELVARGTVLLFAIYPNNAAYVPVLLTETLYTFLLLAACFYLLSGRHWLQTVIAGVVFGLATIVKTQTILLIPILAFLALLDSWSIKKVARAGACAIAVLVIALVVVMPWAVRNYKLLGAVVLSTNGGTTLLSGNNPSVVGDYLHDYSDKDPLYEQAKFSVEDQINADRRARALAISWIMDNPGQFVRLIPKKVFRLWAPDGEAEWMYQDTPFYEQHWAWFRFVRIVNQVFYGITLLFFPLALWKLLAMRAAPVMCIGVAVVLVFTLISIIFSGQSRFHFPAMPFVLAYAAWIVIGFAAPRTPEREAAPK